MEDHRAAYKEEAQELLSDLESGLLELEEKPDDEELIARVFRTLHTIKGSGAMFGFDDVAAFTHEIEAVFDAIRSGRLAVTKELVDQALAARDLIRRMVAEEAVDTTLAADMMGRFRRMLPDAAPALAAGPALEEGQDAPASYHIRFAPHADLFRTGNSPDLIMGELRELGQAQIIAHLDMVPPLSDMRPEDCNIRWEIMLRTGRSMSDIRDVFIFAEDNCDLEILPMESKGIEDRRRIGEILLARGEISAETLEEALRIQETGHPAEPRARQVAITVSSIRVPAEKLDFLVNLVGELVTVQANLTRKSRLLSDAELISIAEEVERLTASLRDNTMGLRMLPIGATFQKFRRLVRDLALELGKEVVMTTSGEDTELDKNMIEQLNDPLVHIIRNEIDHGIEPPSARRALGKPSHGTIHLAASHSGPNVRIRVSGDGAGIDLAAARSKAVERGLIQRDARPTDKELLDLLFAPGFSTAKRVTDVSGRGVGMDVVKRRIESLRGTVDIETEKGVGTTLVLSLPLTLAIIDGLLVSIGGTYFVIPLSAVEECLEMARAAAERARDRGMMSHRGHLILYLSLREFFTIREAAPAIERVVVSEIKGEKVAFGLDQVIGHHQTVIKPLGRVYRDIEGVSGATILGDGSVALILDMPALFEVAEKKAEQRGEAGRTERARL